MTKQVLLDTWAQRIEPDETAIIDVDLVVLGELPEGLQMGSRVENKRMVPPGPNKEAEDAMRQLLAEVGRKPPGELRNVSVSEQHHQHHVLGQREPENVMMEHSISATYDRHFGNAPNADPIDSPLGGREGEWDSINNGHPAQAAGSGNVGMSYVCATCDAPIQRSDEERIERGDDHYCDITCLNEALQEA